MGVEFLPVRFFGIQVHQRFLLVLVKQDAPGTGHYIIVQKYWTDSSDFKHNVMGSTKDGE